jgi:hypothetical protein
MIDSQSCPMTGPLSPPERTRTGNRGLSRAKKAPFFATPTVGARSLAERMLGKTRGRPLLPSRVACSTSRNLSAIFSGPPMVPGVV